VIGLNDSGGIVVKVGEFLCQEFHRFNAGEFKIVDVAI
jgi:hypothetical protein